MADDTNDLIKQMTDALERLDMDINEARKERHLSGKKAQKVDKYILDDIKRKRKEPAGLTKRLGKRALGGVTGAAGRAVGSIPVIGTILRVLGQEIGNGMAAKKQYKKTLIMRRKLELKEQARLERARVKLHEKLQRAQDKKDAEQGEDPSGEPKQKRGGGMNAAVAERLLNAADQLSGAVISMGPAIQTFHEAAERMEEVVERMAEHDPSRVRDEKALEYLYAIDFFTQESAASAERIFASIQTQGKDVGTIKWHVARANGSIGRMEKVLNRIADEKSGGEITMDEDVKKDIGTIKWHVARANGSVGRIEKQLIQAAQDRLKMLDTEKEQLKVEKKQLDIQEDSKFIGILNLLTSFIGGSGLGSLLKDGLVITLAGGAALAIGKAVGDAIRDWIPDNEFTEGMGQQFGLAVDHMLAFFGDKDAKARLGQNNVTMANNTEDVLGDQRGVDRNDPNQIAYAKEHGMYAMKDRYFQNDESKSWYDPDRYLSAPMYPWENQQYRIERGWDQPTAGTQLNQQSAAVDTAKNAPAPSGGNTVQTNQNVTNNSTTVTPSPLSTDPYTIQRPVGNKK